MGGDRFPVINLCNVQDYSLLCLEKVSDNEK